MNAKGQWRFLKGSASPKRATRSPSKRRRATTPRKRRTTVAKKRSSGRSRSKSITLTSIIPAALLAGSALFGNPSLGFGGAIPAARSGNVRGALTELVDIPAMYTIGTAVTHDFKLGQNVPAMAQFYGGAIAGKVAHMAAQKTGANAGLRRLQRTVGLRTAVVV